MLDDRRRSVPDATLRLPAAPSAGLFGVLQARIEADPFNAVATAIFLLAVVAHLLRGPLHRCRPPPATSSGRRGCRGAGLAPTPSVAAELLHFLGEVEVIFGLWGIPLVIAIVALARLDDGDALSRTTP